MSAWQRATGCPTHTHRTAREESGHDVGAGGTAAPADGAFFPPFFFPFPLALPLGLDWSPEESTGPGEVHGRRRRAPRRAPPLQSSFARIQFTFLLVFTGNLPPHAVRKAVASSKAGNEKFLIGPIDKALDDASHVLQGGVTTEVELIVATSELVGSDPQNEALHNPYRQVPTGFSLTNSVNQPRGEPPTLNTRTPKSTAEISLVSNTQTGWSSKGHANELPTTCLP